MKLILFVLFTPAFAALCQNLEKRESYFLKKIEVGTSLTYIWDAEDAGYRYDEFSWNLNTKVSVGKRLYFGVQAIPVFTINRNGLNIEKENYRFLGLLTMYKFLDSDDFSLHAETSLNRSDMFNSFNANPIKKPGLNYIGYGLGGDIVLNKKKRWPPLSGVGLL